MGLGLLGRGVGDAKFLAEEGAELIVTDLKTKEQLADSFKELEQFSNIEFVLGEHRLKDFENRDMIIKAAGVPLDSKFIAEAKKNEIPVEMDASLFARLALAGREGGVEMIGVTGTRGKTTTTMLIYEIARKHFESTTKEVYLGGNIRGTATLPLIRKVKAGDVVVMELDSWQLQGFGEAHISPHISVFTNFMDDHLNYYGGDRKLYFRDKANIFLSQTKDDYLVVGDNLAIEIVKEFGSDLRTKLLRARREKVPSDWNIKLRGEHNLDNIACAIEVGEILGATPEEMREAVESFRPVAGRLQFEKNYHGIYFYNDNNSTTPDATIVGLKALSFKRNTVLIMGGNDKNISMERLIDLIPLYCKAVVLLGGTGTDRIRDRMFKLGDIQVVEEKTLLGSVKHALLLATKGDNILFSPAFTSFGMFKNEYDRGDQFNKIVAELP